MTERDHRPSDAILSTLVGTLRDTALALQSVSETVKHYVDALLRTGTDPPAAVYDEQSIPTSDAQQLNVWRKATVESVRAPPAEGVVGQPNQKK